MYRRCLILVVCMPLAIAGSAAAGDLFSKTDTQNSLEQVPQLLIAIKSDPKPDKRESAAKQLREHDARVFPDIVKVLNEAARSDTDVSVRTEAVRSLGKLKPTTHEAAAALREATKDKSLRVRMQAQTSLLGYRVTEQPVESMKATERAHLPIVSTLPPPKTSRGFFALPWARSNKKETGAPPLAEPVLRGANPTKPMATLEPPVLLTPPSNPVRQIAIQGPDLTPPD